MVPVDQCPVEGLAVSNSGSEAPKPSWPVRFGFPFFMTHRPEPSEVKGLPPGRPTSRSGTRSAASPRRGLARRLARALGRASARPEVAQFRVCYRIDIERRGVEKLRPFASLMKTGPQGVSRRGVRSMCRSWRTPFQALM